MITNIFNDLLTPKLTKLLLKKHFQIAYTLTKIPSEEKLRWYLHLYTD